MISLCIELNVEQRRLLKSIGSTVNETKLAQLRAQFSELTGYIARAKSKETNNA